MWLDMLRALALVFVLEGIMPFAFPQRWKRILAKTAMQDSHVLRMAGFFLMMLGVGLMGLSRL